MRWYLDLRMIAKLMLAFLVILGITAIVGWVGDQGMSSANRDLDRLYATGMVPMSRAQDLRSRVLDIGRLYRQTVMDAGQESARESASKVEATLMTIDPDLAALSSMGLGPQETAIVQDLVATVPDWRARVQQTVRAAVAGDVAGARAAAAANGANATKIASRLKELSEQLEQAGAAKLKAADAAHTRARVVMLTVLALGVMAGLGLGLVIARMISRPVADAARVLGRMAEGDFTQRLRLDTRDELGQMAAALNTALERICETLRDVRSSSLAVAGASQELSAASSSISSGAQEQASSLEQTAASLEEMTSTVKQNADNAQQAAQLAQGARGVAEKGGHVVSEAVTAMGEINASSKQIAEIITAIDEIAFQTNLLALNAAVEAARAGEQGRGFAVVAGEVRNLAQRSASSAKEIKGLIQDSVRKVEAGSELVNRSGRTLDEIVTSVKRVTDIISEIAAASREQATGIDQVGKAVSQMDQVTQSNAAQTEELAGTAESLTSQADQLQSLVARFRLEAVGEGAAPMMGMVHPAARRPAVQRPALRVVPPVLTSGPAERTGTDAGFQEF